MFLGKDVERTSSLMSYFMILVMAMATGASVNGSPFTYVHDGWRGWKRVNLKYDTNDATDKYD